MRPFLLLLSGLLICACERDKSPMAPAGGWIYPLQVGNEWEYQRSFMITNFRPQEEGRTMPNDTLRATITVRIVKEIVLQDSIKTVQLYEEYVGDSGNFADESYYGNKQGGLYFYAYYQASGSPMIPKQAVGALLFNGQRFHNVSEITRLLTHVVAEPASDSLIYETPPLLALKYPVALNSQWTYRKAGPFRIDKRVVAREDVTVPAGTYSCYKIQWLFDINANGDWDDNIIFYDDVCEKGLIRRSILYKDVQAVGVDLEPLGAYDAVDESVSSRLVIRSGEN